MQTFFEALTNESQEKFTRLALGLVGISWSPLYSPPPRHKTKLEDTEEISKIMSQKPASKKELEKDG